MPPSSPSSPSSRQEERQRLSELPCSTAEASHRAARGTLFSFLLRILSFTLSQLTVRLVDPATLGRASIRLELLLNTILFLGREGFRLALTRVSTDYSDSDKEQNDSGEDDKECSESRKRKAAQMNNVSWLSLPVGVLFSFLALAVHCHSCTYSTSDGNDSLDYRVAGILYCLAASIESLSEPLVIHCMQTLDVTTRATAEGLAAVGKASASVLLLSYASSSWPVTAFAIAQCVYSTLFSTVLYYRRWNNIQWPHLLNAPTVAAPPSNPYRLQPSHIRLLSLPLTLFKSLTRSLHSPTLHLSLVFSLQSIFKHVLTEGDRIVLTSLSTSYDQGVYAMASAYGGMASRLLFQPMEENARLLFSTQNTLLLSQTTKSDKRRMEIVTELQESYTILVKLVVYVGLFFAAIASNYTTVLLTVLAGQTWGGNTENDTKGGEDAATALSAFCIYTVFMAANGMTEAFVYGVVGATTSGTTSINDNETSSTNRESGSGQVGRLALAHGVVGVIFYVIAPFLVVRYGTVGLVIANGSSMIVRMVYSIHFAALYFNNSRHYHHCDEEGIVGGDDGLKQQQRQGEKMDKVDSMMKGRNKFSNLFMEMKQMLHLWKQTLPHPMVFIAFIASFVITRYSQLHMMTTMESELEWNHWLLLTSQHLGLGILCASCIGVLLYRYEKRFGSQIQSIWYGRNKRKQA